MAVCVSILDIDGTLCPSIFSNDRLQNDNRNTLTSSFLCDLRCVKAYEWVQMRFWNPANIHCIITGRMREHEDLTRWWFHHWTNRTLNSYTSVEWDDTFATRDESYQHYIVQKTVAICCTVDGFNNSAKITGVAFEFVIVEDDEHVLTRLWEMRPDVRRSLWIVRDGRAPVRFVPPGWLVAVAPGGEQ
jgi:hypothetical protein